MKTISDIIEIKEITKNNISLGGEQKTRVVVGMATCGFAAGAQPILTTINDEVKKANLNDKVAVSQTGCIGICQYEPIVEVYDNGGRRTTYVNMTADRAKRIATEHIKDGNIVTEYTIGAANGENVTSVIETEFMKKQKRVSMRNCGIIDPEKIDEYIAMDGYQALHKVINEMKPEELIQFILDSGLRGRGGAGFPTGLKWRFAAASVSDKKYVCCNADEGDPGAFMDRSILEGDPHAVIEAMAIAGYAIGADEGYIYVRAEYPTAISRLTIAIEQAKTYGLLGKGIMGTDFNFDITLRLGAGAFVCGEETALLTSIEGKRGEPRLRPPFPAVKGLFGKPTILNNVETYANITQIIVNGIDWFRSMGTEKSKGTKVFALGGKITNTGLVEIPMGTTLREIIEEIGGGIPDGKKYKAAQTGGPSGGCIPMSLIDTPIEYDTLVAIGSMMGSGGLIVMDEDNCMVDIARFFLDFTVDESCGKCTPCRIGTRRLLEILDKIIEGNGELKDLEKLQELCEYISSASLCGLGQTAPNPVLSTIKYFKDEYIAHISEKRCPSGVCKNLLRYIIIEDKCTGCSACARVCPVDAISGEIRKKYVIDPVKCIKCGACMEKCRFSAIIKR